MIFLTFFFYIVTFYLFFTFFSTVNQFFLVFFFFFILPLTRFTHTDISFTVSNPIYRFQSFISRCFPPFRLNIPALIQFLLHINSTVFPSYLYLNNFTLISIPCNICKSRPSLISVFFLIWTLPYYLFPIYLCNISVIYNFPSLFYRYPFFLSIIYI